MSGEAQRESEQQQEVIEEPNAWIRNLSEILGVVVFGTAGTIIGYRGNNDDSTLDLISPHQYATFSGFLIGSLVGVAVGWFTGFAIESSIAEKAADSNAVKMISPRDRVNELESEARSSPENSDIWDQLGDAQVSEGDYNSALRSYKYALHLSPKNADLQFKIQALLAPVTPTPAVR